jgi:hypothetical protein
MESMIWLRLRGSDEKWAIGLGEVSKHKLLHNLIFLNMYFHGINGVFKLYNFQDAEMEE